MKYLPRCLAIILFLFTLSAEARAGLKVVTTLPDLAWAAREIGGDGVSVVSLLRGTENPHFADAVPDFIAKAASADVLCAVGLELEVGWLPKVLSRSGNAKVQTGGAGFCETGPAVEVIDKPAGAIDRSMGDVHPYGNPHFWISPLALAEGARAIRDALVRVDGAHRALYEANYRKLKTKLDSIHRKNLEKLKPYAGQPIFMEYHQEFAYFFSAYGLRSAGSLEEKPGVPPSAGRIAGAANSAKGEVKLLLASETNPESTLKKFSEISGIPFVILPVMSHVKGEPRDYEALQNRIVEAVLGKLK